MAISIRVWKQEDVENLALYANNVNIWNNMRNYFPHPYGEEEARDWIKKAIEEVPLVNFAIDVDGEARRNRVRTEHRHLPLFSRNCLLARRALLGQRNNFRSREAND
jgi:hypothetical protein